MKHKTAPPRNKKKNPNPTPPPPPTYPAKHLDASGGVFKARKPAKKLNISTKAKSQSRLSETSLSVNCEFYMKTTPNSHLPK